MQLGKNHCPAPVVLGQRRRPSERSERISTSRRDRVSAAIWAERAAAHEAAGEWDLAVRCHYRAAMARLADSKRITESPGATSGTWRAEALANDVADEPVSDLTDVFETAWYRDLDISREDADRARRSADAISPGGTR